MMKINFIVLNLLQLLFIVPDRKLPANESSCAVIVENNVVIKHTKIFAFRSFILSLMIYLKVL